VAQGLRNEEGQFFEVINAGMPRVERLFEETAKAKSKIVSGREAFNLLQTYGFRRVDRDARPGAGWRSIGRPEEGPAGPRRSLRRRAAEGTLQAGPLDKICETLRASEFLGYETEKADGLSWACWSTTSFLQARRTRQ